MVGDRINKAGEKFIGALSYATPSSYPFRNVGTRTEVGATLMADGHTIDLDLVADWTEHPGDISWGRGVSELKQPVFATMRLSAQVLADSGVWQLAGLLTPPPARAEGKLWGAAPLSPDRVLLFVRATASRGPKINPAPEQPLLQQVQVLAEWIETDTATSAALLTKYPDFANSPELREEMEPMIKDGRAALLQTAAVVVRAGQRSKTESIVEFSVPGEQDPPQGGGAFRDSPIQPDTSPVKSKHGMESGKPYSSNFPWGSLVPAMPACFTPGNTGTTVDAEALVLNGKVHLHVGCPLRFADNVESFGQGTVQIERLSFQILDAPAVMILAPGVPGMAGSVDAPGNGGRENKGQTAFPAARTRKVLLFVRGFN
jgi:hypothetical protein